jgi:hypothetical protein
MFAWLLRGLVVNEFDSGKYNELSTSPRPRTRPLLSRGEATIIRFGFTNSDGDAYTFEWAGWGILFTLSGPSLLFWGLHTSCLPFAFYRRFCGY